MLWPLAALTLLLSAADHWTTYLCLRQPVSGWQVTEANPISGWLFASVGLVPGLFLDSVVTVAAVTFLVQTRRLGGITKTTMFCIVAGATAYAVLNNYRALLALGLEPWGIG